MSENGKVNTNSHPITEKTKKAGPLEVCRRFLDRSAARDASLVALLSEHATMVGVSADRLGFNPEETRNSLLTGLEKSPLPLEYEILRCSEDRPNDRTAVVLFVLRYCWPGMPPILRNWPTRASFTVVREQREWRIAHLHFSTGNPNLEAGERFPHMASRLLQTGEPDSLQEKLLSLQSANRLQEERIAALQAQVADARRLEGYVTVCAGCHKVREESGQLVELEEYIEARCGVRFTHTLCRECQKVYFPGCSRTALRSVPASPGPDAGSEPLPPADGC